MKKNRRIGILFAILVAVLLMIPFTVQVHAEPSISGMGAFQLRGTPGTRVVENFQVLFRETHFRNLTRNMNISSWFENLPKGLEAHALNYEDRGVRLLTIQIYGTPEEPCVDQIKLKIPAEHTECGKELVLNDPNVVFLIGARIQYDFAASHYLIKFGETLNNAGLDIELTGDKFSSHLINKTVQLTNLLPNKEDLPEGVEVSLEVLTRKKGRLIFTGTPKESGLFIMSIDIPAAVLSGGYPSAGSCTTWFEIAEITIPDTCIDIVVGEPLEPTEFSVNFHGLYLGRNALSEDMDVTSWFQSLPDGLNVKIKNYANKSITFALYGTSNVKGKSVIDFTVPKSVLDDQMELRVTRNENAVIVVDRGARYALHNGTTGESVETISGEVGTEISQGNYVLTVSLSGDSFKGNIDTNVKNWFAGLPDGLEARIPVLPAKGDQELNISVYGTPTRAANESILITVPGNALESGESLVVREKAEGVFAISAGIPIDKDHFPDEKFRTEISSFDTNGDLHLSGAERRAVDKLHIDSCGIASLQGIEYFSALTELLCPDNQLTSLDVSKNTKLEKLVCRNNRISSLDVSKLAALIKLDCGGNSLTELDVSRNEKLQSLSCTNNPLTVVGVTANSELKQLAVGGSRITTLDVTANPKLISLNAENCKLTELDLSENPNLVSLYCSDNALTSLKLNPKAKLSALYCDNNHLTCLAQRDFSSEHSEFSAKGQTAEGKCVYKNGKWIVDLGTFGLNLADVTVTDGGVLDTQTGKVTYTAEPSACSYRYRIGAYSPERNVVKDAFLEATLNLSLQQLNPEKKDFTFALTSGQNAVCDGTAKTLNAKLLDDETHPVTLKYYDENGAETSMIHAGTYTVKATMAENRFYQAVADLVIGTFTVEPRVVQIEWGAQSEFEYDGQPHAVSASVANGVAGDTLTLTVTGETATDAGSYTARVTGIDHPDYTITGAQDLEHTWQIKKAQNHITGLSLDGWIYGNAPHTPQATAKFGTVSFTYSDKQDGVFTQQIPQNAGNYFVKAFVEETGNYSEVTETLAFTITPKALTAENIAEISSQSFNGLPFEPVLTVKDGDTALVKDTDYTVVYENNVNAGTAKALVTFTGNYSGNAEKTFTIAPKPIVGDIADIPEQIYNASPLMPEIVIKDGETRLIKDSDYTVVYEDNIFVGTAKVHITFVGNYSGSAAKTFAIVQATPLIAEYPTAAQIMAGSTLADSALRGGVAHDAQGNVMPGLFMWKDDSPQFKEKGDYTASALFVPTDENNYKTVEFDVPVHVYVISNISTINYRTYYTVSFQTNGGSTVASRRVASSDTVGEPEDPVKEDYTFAGWYKDKNFKNAYDFSDKVTSSFTLYAKWTKTDNSAHEIVLTIGEKTAVVFGKRVTNDVAPLIVKDRTMLPARFVAESLGAKVEWDEEKELVTITGKHLKTGKGVKILITIGSAEAFVNDEAVTLDSQAFLQNDRTYTPVRFISEELGADVEWIEAEEKVVISVPAE